MTIGELMEKLVELAEDHGADQQVIIDHCSGTGGLHTIEEVDIDVEDRIVIWCGDMVE